MTRDSEELRRRRRRDPGRSTPQSLARTHQLQPAAKPIGIHPAIVMRRPISSTRDDGVSIAVVFVTVTRGAARRGRRVGSVHLDDARRALAGTMLLTPLDRTIESAPPLNAHDEIAANADGAATWRGAWNVIDAATAAAAAERRRLACFLARGNSHAASLAASAHTLLP